MMTPDDHLLADFIMQYPILLHEFDNVIDLDDGLPSTFSIRYTT